MINDTEIVRSCETCRYCESKLLPPSIERVRICRRFPPVPIAMQNPDGRIGTMSAFPLVGVDTWCHEWTAVQAANKLMTEG